MRAASAHDSTFRLGCKYTQNRLKPQHTSLEATKTKSLTDRCLVVNVEYVTFVS